MSTWALVSAIAVGVVSFAAMSFIRSSRKRCNSDADLTGKVAIVTGANAGIGYWTARDFATRHARVILACRSEERAKAAQEKIVAETGNDNVVVRRLDLFDFNSVRKFSEQIHKEEDRLDILVNNAGVVGVPQMASEHGLEATWAINHFGPFLLTLLLMDLLKTSAPSRIVNVSAASQNFKSAVIDFDNFRNEKNKGTMALCTSSKLANVLFTKELARRLDGTGVTANCLHPGGVQTEIWRNMSFFMRGIMSIISLFFRTAEEGAQTSIYLAVSSEVEGKSGQYYVDCALAEDQVNPISNDSELTRKFWEVSAHLTGVSGDI